MLHGDIISSSGVFPFTCNTSMFALPCHSSMNDFNLISKCLWNRNLILKFFSEQDLTIRIFVQNFSILTTYYYLLLKFSMMRIKFHFCYIQGSQIWRIKGRLRIEWWKCLVMRQSASERLLLRNLHQMWWWHELW